MIRQNREPESLKVGDRVTTDYLYSAPEAVRTIVEVGSDPTFQDGRYVVLSASEPCPSCGHVRAGQTPRIAAAWAIPVTAAPAPSSAEQEIAEIEKRWEAATPGPWVWYSGCSYWRLGLSDQHDHDKIIRPTKDSDGHPNLDCTKANREAIAAAPTDIRRLIEIARAAIRQPSADSDSREEKA